MNYDEFDCPFCTPPPGVKKLTMKEYLDKWYFKNEDGSDVKVSFTFEDQTIGEEAAF